MSQPDARGGEAEVLGGARKKTIGIAKKVAGCAGRVIAVRGVERVRAEADSGAEGGVQPGVESCVRQGARIAGWRGRDRLQAACEL